MKPFFKNLCFYLSYIIVWPSGLVVNLEKQMNLQAEDWFAFSLSSGPWCRGCPATTCGPRFIGRCSIFVIRRV